MTWVYACRWLFEQSAGHVLPPQVAMLTYDQFFAIWLDGASIGYAPRGLSEQEASDAGYIEPGGKTAYQLAQEAEAQRLAGQEKAARRGKRAERRAARVAQEVAGV